HIKREIQPQLIKIRLQFRVDVLDFTLELANIRSHFVQINFFFRLKGINIAGNVEVKAVLFNLLHRRHMSILINVLTALVCVYDLVDVALPEDVLILSSLKVFGSVDEQDVIRIAVALPLEYEDTDRNTGAEEEVCRKTNDGIQHIQLLDEVLADHLFGSATEENTMREK